MYLVSVFSCFLLLNFVVHSEAFNLLMIGNFITSVEASLENDYFSKPSFGVAGFWLWVCSRILHLPLIGDETWKPVWSNTQFFWHWILVLFMTHRQTRYFYTREWMAHNSYVCLVNLIQLEKTIVSSTNWKLISCKN